MKPNRTEIVVSRWQADDMTLAVSDMFRRTQRTMIDCLREQYERGYADGRGDALERKRKRKARR